MQLEVLWIMMTVLIGAFISSAALVYFYRRKVITRNPVALRMLAVGGGVCLLAGALLIIFAFRTLMFMVGFILVLVGILLIIGAVWSVLYAMKEMINVIKRVAEGGE